MRNVCVEENSENMRRIWNAKLPSNRKICVTSLVIFSINAIISGTVTRLLRPEVGDEVHRREVHYNRVCFGHMFLCVDMKGVF